MHKRFTDIHKWQDPWFRKLQPIYKLLWSYICDHCDNAGVWKVDIDMAAFFIGEAVSEEAALTHLKGRVEPLRDGYWFIPSFVAFQFKHLSIRSPLHSSVLELLKKHGIEPPKLRLGEALPKAYASLQVKVKVTDVKDFDVKKRGEVEGRETKKRFSVPQPDEVTNYAKSIGFVLNGQYFCDYYETRGWKIGNNHMKNWQAAVRTWKNKHQENNGIVTAATKPYDLAGDLRRAREENKRGAEKHGSHDSQSADLLETEL